MHIWLAGFVWFCICMSLAFIVLQKALANETEYIALSSLSLDVIMYRFRVQRTISCCVCIERNHSWIGYQHLPVGCNKIGALAVLLLTVESAVHS
ncbi:hypothetical protein V1522DRAFT_401050 [Lipomyces starkeyi]